ncbi:MAG: gamma-glutamyl-gamma-aminobutyrate hydrolase family protein [Thermodesulfobacteriaceae bacterium]|nr:gamma-glutamyl-gamma-aminobutyrate hydrolase family protein [Thermodesulfobacteriaceae bacterium]MCX8041804.1 gamma-glutamyl-gamma-aminobutyrate hydrolase family protein [Thermodesulfobacteriaceae bacterium]MDW8136180.1 gamma-glutamyl-gamma-aminobutyrate hydrolase family protein [Thermodesulfobacterium sp.]
MNSKVIAIRHVKIENLGSLENLLKKLGFEIEYLDTFQGAKLDKSLEKYAFLVVLGGPMGVYEVSKYPFLNYELSLIEEALKREIPLLGICLGAQLLAKVLGAEVYPGPIKEIGWLEVFKVEEHPYFIQFPEKLKVFQWHGDTFDLPSGAIRVFSSKYYENQGFVYGKAVGLQFHIEVDKDLAKLWAKEYLTELTEEGLSEEILIKVEEKEVENLKKLALSLIKRLVF